MLGIINQGNVSIFSRCSQLVPFHVTVVFYVCLPQQAQALDDGRLFGALTASGKSSSEGLREILGFWVGHRFAAVISYSFWVY